MTGKQLVHLEDYIADLEEGVRELVGAWHGSRLLPDIEAAVNRLRDTVETETGRDLQAEADALASDNEGRAF